MRKQGRMAHKEILLLNSNPRDRDVPGIFAVTGCFPTPCVRFYGIV